MTTPQPPHPLHALTTTELSGYRRQLEHALTATTADPQSRALLRAQLEEALAEQQSRHAITAAIGREHP